jgi:GT2 family glycosyltransferase
MSVDRKVQAIVVAYNEAAQLERCLVALASQVDVTVVDNSSSEDVRVTTLRQCARYVDAGANLGFAGGVDLELQRLMSGTPCDVLLLNPDALLAPEDLQGLSRHLHLSGNERVAAVSPRLVGTDGTGQRVTWPFPSPIRAWLEAVGLGRLPARRTFVIGAVLLLRWEAILDVGLLDDRFFLYAEEADWQRRAAAHGWVSQVCTDAIASHVGAGTSTDPRTRERLFHAAQETYIRKWHGRSGWLLYRAAAVLGAAGRALALGGDRRTEAARRARLYLRGPRRCAATARE